jgi:hypothetical protein
MPWRNASAVALMMGTAALAGCTGPTTWDPPIDHPANPRAAVTPPPERSTVLSVAAAGTPSEVGTSGDAAAPPSVPADAGHAHAGHAHGGTGGAETAATPVADHRPAEGMPVSSTAGRTYECPMHPEVVSPDPSAECPKCGMKINKPRAANSPVPTSPVPTESAPAVTAPALTAPTAGGHAGHDGGH